MIVALAPATQVAAQAPRPATTAFDGKYTGVSKEVFKYSPNPGGAHFCTLPNNDPPPPLLITNGVVQEAIAGGPEWGGTITPQGALVLHNKRFTRLDGQIDNQGNIRGLISGTFCAYIFAWRKQSR